MNAPAELPPAAATMELGRIFARQRNAFAAERYPGLAVRLDRLTRLKALVRNNEDRFVAAVAQDFGHRSAHETRLAELYIVVAEIAHAQKHLARWMRARRVATPLHLLPGRARIERQPVGVVGIISPWNYPVQLALAPALGALAAGNRVLLKPSELTPATSALLQSLVAAQFAQDEFAVVLGDAEAGRAFTQLPFDHLFFTGSTAVGRQVARAAADNLTPVTLELGGKSPALFAPDADFALTAPRLMSGKLLNAGQTCIAPDYVLVPRGSEGAFGEAFARAVAKLFPSIVGNPDYAAIISPRHHERLQALLAQAEGEGARLQVVNPGAGTVGAARQMAPVLVFDTTPAMKLMDEEIFGPILPVLPYASMDEAISYINDRPRPLALYWFGSDTAARDDVLARTVSGGVTVNDTLMHIAHENLPFGGVGDSGWGAYHGEAGFLRFTQQKPVLVQSKWARGDLFYPPYGKRFDQVMGLLKRLI